MISESETVVEILNKNVNEIAGGGGGIEFNDPIPAKILYGWYVIIYDWEIWWPPKHPDHKNILSSRIVIRFCSCNRKWCKVLYYQYG